MHALGWIGMGMWDPEWEKSLGAWPQIRNLMPEVLEGETTQIEVGLWRGRRLRGTVRDPAGMPVADARVSVKKHLVPFVHPDMTLWTEFSLCPPRPVTTAADGRFELTVAPEGAVGLHVHAGPLGTEHRTLEMTDVEGPLAINLDQSCSWRGHVLDAEGSGVPAQLLCFHPAPGGQVVSTVADDSGAFNVPMKGATPPVILAYVQEYGWAMAIASDPSLEVTLQLTAPRKAITRVIDEKGKCGAHGFRIPGNSAQNRKPARRHFDDGHGPVRRTPGEGGGGRRAASGVADFPASG
jgi:hypothetical protein